MRTFAALIVVLISTTAEATVRCAGTTVQYMTVESGQAFTLPVQAIAGALDYEVTRATDWFVNNSETWGIRGTLSTSSTRPGSAGPSIREQLYNTRASFDQPIYYVVTAKNPDDSVFRQCAQDFLVSVGPDRVLSRDTARAVIPVAGSLQGANGSRYETRLTLQNPWDGPPAITGRIVFHPTGRPASADDPDIRYTLDPHETRAWDDVVEAMGAGGLGSIDILPDRHGNGAYLLPDVRAEVVSIAPNGGTFGMEVPLVSPTSPYIGAFWTLSQPDTILVDDRDGAKRLAIGIRTLADTVELTVRLVAPDGSVRASVTREWGPDHHEQRPLSEWFGTLAQRHDRLEFWAMHRSASLPGGAIIYLAETDNVTNDVALVIPQRHASTLLEPIVQCSPTTGCNLMVPW